METEVSEVAVEGVMGEVAEVATNGEVAANILEAINSAVAAVEIDASLWGVWLLIGAVLVFFMQCGFAMVEAGFTRAKNSANIIMKNLMDFSLGAVFFALLGYSLLTGESGGFIGALSFDFFTDFENFDYADFVFNLVFCATAATIVAGAMAERTKFSSYMIYSIIVCAIIYPIQAGWVWNENGWLANMGFIDFAGSAAIHMVGGIAAFVGAAVLGPRIGKYTAGKDGKKITHAIPGHSLTLGALGVFILWFGWYGFNGAAAENVPQLGSIFLTTTMAPAMGAVMVMIITWAKNGKPDVSMSLNGALAGLVGITAGCSSVDAFGAIMIGLVAGVIVVFAVEFIDMKLHVDDPVGAVAVHGVCGVWGALAVGLFARPITVGDAVISEDAGLFYGGGLDLFVTQGIGVVSIAAWTIVTSVIMFVVIKKTVGLRASKDDELRGLDISEHGLVTSSVDMMVAEEELPATSGGAPLPASVTVPVIDKSNPGAKMTKVVIVTKRSKFEMLKSALDKIDITGMTVTQVLGCGMQKGSTEFYRGVPIETTLLPKVQVEVVVCKVPVSQVVDAAKRALYTGNIGDGKIFVYDVENVIKVRTGEEGYAALQDKE